MASHWSSTTILTSTALADASATGSNATNYLTLGYSPTGAVFILSAAVTGSLATLLVTVQEGWYDFTTGDSTVGATTSGTLTWTDTYGFVNINGSSSTQILRIGANTGISIGNTSLQSSTMSNVQRAGPISNFLRVGWLLTSSGGGSTATANFTVAARFAD